jgi:hypothetical protein
MRLKFPERRFSVTNIIQISNSIENKTINNSIELDKKKLLKLNLN